MGRFPHIIYYTTNPWKKATFFADFLSPFRIFGNLFAIDETVLAETMDETTEINLVFDKALLYKNMVAAKAEWLYELPQWEAIFDEATRKALYLDQKKSGTIIKDKKVGRNDPCPCGSGRKFKQCCGRK